VYVCVRVCERECVCVHMHEQESQALVSAHVGPDLKRACRLFGR